MAVIDTLTAKARNALKKTGDKMLAGDLELFQNPTQNMHATTKLYVDNAVGAGSGTPFRPQANGRWYGPTYAQGSASASVINNEARLSPMWTGVGGGSSITISSIGFMAISWDSIYRFGFYALDSNTLLPQTLLFEGVWTTGVLSSTFGQTTLAALGYENFTTTFPWIGLGVRVEGIISDTISGTLCMTNGNFEFAPYGHNPSASNRRGCGTLLSSNLTPGAMPAPGTFAPVNEVINYDHGLVVKLV